MVERTTLVIPPTAIPEKLKKKRKYTLANYTLLLAYTTPMGCSGGGGGRPSPTPLSPQDIFTSLPHIHSPPPPTPLRWSLDPSPE